MTKHINGYTGDCLGTAQQLQELLRQPTNTSRQDENRLSSGLGRLYSDPNPSPNHNHLVRKFGHIAKFKENISLSPLDNVDRSEDED